MDEEMVIGIDLGGTNVRAGVVHGNKLATQVQSARITSDGTIDDVLNELFHVTDMLMNASVKAIGVGVPGLVDVKNGIVFDVMNIPSWSEVPLKTLMQSRYQVPVTVNNDANCFALAEYHFGKHKGCDSLIGLNCGTGLGAGIIIQNKLYSGANCGAGEFGMVDYLDKNYEYYACGQFFQNVYQLNGEEVFARAQQGDRVALKMYGEMGTHLGNAIKMILYTFDTDLIVLGGSVCHAWPYFSETMWDRIGTFAFRRSVDRLRITVSELQNGGVLGASALHYDSKQ